MKLLIVTITFYFIFHGNVPVAEGNPFGNSPSSMGGLSHHRQQQQFGEGVRDWFRGAKNRVFGSSDGPDISKITSQTKESYQQEKGLLDSILLDLSKISFDPQHDWGFRLGHWYFIRKEYDSPRSSNWTPPPGLQEIPDEPDWTEYKFDEQTGLYRPGVSVNEIAPPPTESTSTPATAEEKIVSKELNDDDSPKSAEVILPKN